VRQSIDATRERLGRLFFQRCFYLFIMLLCLIATAPFLEALPKGIAIRNIVNSFIILSTVAAVGRSAGSFMIVVLLAAPALGFRWLSLETGEVGYYDLSLKFDLALYIATVGFLLRYVFAREVLNTDRLWGAAAAYLMIGVLWSFLYTLIDRANTEAFAVRGVAAPLQFIDAIYFSFSTLTTTGFGDIIPIGRSARVATLLEGIVGQLFLAILIARLVGIYPPSERPSATIAPG
jgi:hypothetical protein